MTLNLTDQILQAHTGRPSVKERMAAGKALRQINPGGPLNAPVRAANSFIPSIDSTSLNGLAGPISWRAGHEERLGRVRVQGLEVERRT